MVSQGRKNSSITFQIKINLVILFIYLPFPEDESIYDVYVYTYKGSYKFAFKRYASPLLINICGLDFLHGAKTKFVEVEDVLFSRIHYGGFCVEVYYFSRFCYRDQRM